MTKEKPNSDIDMPGSSNKQWLIASLVVSVVVLVGMFLPWVSGFDLGSIAVAGGRVNGWSVSWLLITVLIGLTLFIGLVFVKPRIFKLLSLAAMLCCCAASLIPIVDLGLVTLGSSGKGSFGTFLIISKIPLAGFWVTLLGIIGMIVFGVAIWLKTTPPKK